MEGPEQRPGGCFDRHFSALTVDDVYEIAKAIGADVERLIDACGEACVAALVAKSVKVLELLESFASRNDAHKLREDELLKTFESLRLQQRRRRREEEEEEEEDEEEQTRELRQKEQQWRRRCEELQLQVQQLQEDRTELQDRLKGNHAQEDRIQRQEREVMLKLKEVVDRQRDELRAKVQQITTVSKEVEALQEQLERFMKMNTELRHKQNVLQAQLRSSVERKADMEADLREKSRAIERLSEQLRGTDAGDSSSPRPSAPASPDQAREEQKGADQPCFTKKEVRDIIFERNELKTNLFLVQEELSYYQREILSEERCPGFLLEAVRSAIRKRRRVIKAKMLGRPVNDCSSSDDEDRTSLDGSTEVDGVDKPSRIRNLFGFLTWTGSGRSPTQMSSSTSAWEIIGDSEAGDEAGRGASS